MEPVGPLLRAVEDNMVAFMQLGPKAKPLQQEALPVEHVGFAFGQAGAGLREASALRPLEHLGNRRAHCESHQSDGSLSSICTQASLPQYKPQYATTQILGTSKTGPLGLGSLL